MKSCGKSAGKLVALVARHFPGKKIVLFYQLAILLDSTETMNVYFLNDILRKENIWFIISFNANVKANHITLLGFRDHSVYKGHQVFLYKRAQIFAADLWGAFKGQGYGEFHDIGSITIFADYIVPAVLRQLGVLKYDSALTSTIEANNEIVSGTEEEVELRACSIYAVEKMRELISRKLGKQVITSFSFMFLPFQLLFNNSIL